MNDSLIPYQHNTLETREESLTRQFYEWEGRGRGWQVRSFPVALEPPFRPFYLFDTAPGQAVDDGRLPTFFSKLIEDFGKNSRAGNGADSQLPRYQERSAEMDEPAVCEYYDEEFTEIQLILPKDLRITKPISEQLLLSLSYCSHPISFEIIGTRERIIVQMAATGRDYAQLRQQLKAHVPQAILNESNCSLSDSWQDNGDHEVIADFGLSHEFMLPLSPVSSFDIDPLVAVTGALSDLRADEIGVFQVLFQKARFDWAEEILSSVRFFDGTPFFVNAPEMIPLAKQKISRPLFAVCVRVAAKSYIQERTWQIVRSLGAGLSQLANPAGNELIPLSNEGYDPYYHEQSLLDRTSCRCGMILNSEELVSLVHPPSQAVQSEKLVRESERTKPAPPAALGHPLFLGTNEHQGETRKVTISNDQRSRHVHLIGSSGSGKSTLMLNLIKQDLEAGQGLCVLDPHGDLIDSVIAHVPEIRLKDVILFDPSDAEYPIGFNILDAKTEMEKTLLASDLIATFRRLSTSWGDVMDSVLANAILAFVESSRGGTLFDLKRFLVEKDFRREFLETVRDEGVRYFWTNEFPLLSGKPQSSILIRLDAFMRQKLVRNIVCQTETKINFREVMDNRKVLLIKLSQGAIGEENASLLGTLLISKLYQSALSRQNTPNRPFFACYLDEFHHFITPSMENILSGVRKYNLGLVLAHQEFRQLNSRSSEVAASVLSNCYTRICFRLGDTDAERFSSGFSFFDADSLQNLSVGEAVGRIERADYDFNLKTAPLPAVSRETAEKRRAEIIKRTRERYAKTKAEVEAELIITRISQADASSPSGKIKVDEPETTPVNVPEAEEKTAQNFVPKTILPEAKVKKDAFPDSPVFLPTAESPSGKGTQQHRYLQSLVKRMAESRGFLVILEKEVFGGIGKIDVALESDTQKIACEISVTNEPDYEVQNIRKCLAAGYAPVVLISADHRHLDKIKRNAAENLPPEDLAKTEFFTPEEFHLWLENLETNRSGDKEKVKGFKVNVKLKPVDETERSSRKRAISEVVFGALKKLKNKLDDK